MDGEGFAPGVTSVAHWLYGGPEDGGRVFWHAILPGINFEGHAYAPRRCACCGDVQAEEYDPGELALGCDDYQDVLKRSGQRVLIVRCDYQGKVKSCALPT